MASGAGVLEINGSEKQETLQTKSDAAEVACFLGREIELTRYARDHTDMMHRRQRTSYTRPQESVGRATLTLRLCDPESTACRVVVFQKYLDLLPARFSACSSYHS